MKNNSSEKLSTQNSKQDQEILMEMGGVYMSTGFYNEAEKIFDKAISYYESDTLLYVLRASAIQKSERENYLSDAYIDLENAIKFYDGKDSSVLFRIADVYMNLKEFKLAKKYIEMFLEKDENIDENQAAYTALCYACHALLKMETDNNNKKNLLLLVDKYFKLAWESVKKEEIADSETFNNKCEVYIKLLLCKPENAKLRQEFYLLLVSAMVTSVVTIENIKKLYDVIIKNHEKSSKEMTMFYLYKATISLTAEDFESAKEDYKRIEKEDTAYKKEIDYHYVKKSLDMLKFARELDKNINVLSEHIKTASTEKFELTNLKKDFDDIKTRYEVLVKKIDSNFKVWKECSSEETKKEYDRQTKEISNVKKELGKLKKRLIYDKNFENILSSFTTIDSSTPKPKKNEIKKQKLKKNNESKSEKIKAKYKEEIIKKIEQEEQIKKQERILKRDAVKKIEEKKIQNNLKPLKEIEFSKKPKEINKKNKDKKSIEIIDDKKMHDNFWLYFLEESKRKPVERKKIKDIKIKEPDWVKELEIEEDNKKNENLKGGYGTRS